MGSIGVAAWFRPNVENHSLVAATREHSARDRRDLHQARGMWPRHVSAVLHAFIEEHKNGLLPLPGCAGVHGPGRNRRGDSPTVLALVADAAFRLNLPFEARFRADGELYFPFSRMLVNVTPYSGVSVRVAGQDSIVVSGGDGTVSWNPLDDDATDASLVRLPILSPAAGLFFEECTWHKPPADFGLDRFDQCSVGVLTDTMRVLAAIDEPLSAELGVLPVWICPLEGSNRRISYTVDDLPSLVFLNTIDALETLDLFVHEYHHLKLNLLQESDALLERPLEAVPAPWRTDMRTAIGVVHGAYVFANVARTFEAVFAKAAPSPQGQRRRVAWHLAVARAARDIRAASPGFTELGGLLVDDLQAEADRWLEAHHAELGREMIEMRDAIDTHIQRVRAGISTSTEFMAGLAEG